MANNVITQGNSFFGYIHDSDQDNFLLVTEGGFLIYDGSSGAAYSADGNADVTIKGSVICQFFTAINIDGYSNIKISSYGLVSGSTAIVASENYNYINNSGKISGLVSSGTGIFLRREFFINHK